MFFLFFIFYDVLYMIRWYTVAGSSLLKRNALLLLCLILVPTV